MFLSEKEYIFFAIVFISVFLIARGGLIVGNRSKLSTTFSLLITSVLTTLLLLLVYKYAKISEQKDSFHFEVSGPKLCQGGPYMWSSASKEEQDYCNKLMSTPEGQHEYAQMNCQSGFIGRPVHWDYSSLSNDKWENDTCNPPYINMNDPCVL